MQPDRDAPPLCRRPREAPSLIPRAGRLLHWFNIRAPLDDARARALSAARLQSDPLGDALVEWMERAPQGVGRRMFEQAVEQGIERVPDAPLELRALLDQVERTPAWLDRTRAAEGAAAMLRQGAEGLCALSAVSLMGGYLSSNATKPLVRTGALTRMAPRRLAETMHFVSAIANSPGLERDSDGYKTTLRVRLMHALVRRKLLSAPDWRRDEWGIPINQHDMVGTHLTFTVLFVAGVTTLGRIVTLRERDAIMHLWRYVSFLLGTPDELLPRTFREGLEIGELFNATEPGPDDDSRALARALMDAWSSNDPERPGGPRAARVFGSFMPGFARYALGKEAADLLGVPDTSWKYVPPAMALFRFSSELVGLLQPQRRARGVEIGRRLFQRNTEVTLRGKPARYVAAHEALA